MNGTGLKQRKGDFMKKKSGKLGILGVIFAIVYLPLAVIFELAKNKKYR